MLLPAAGKYLVTASVALLAGVGVSASDTVELKLYNSTAAADVPASEQKVSALIDTQKLQVVLNAIVETPGANQTIALYGNCTTDAAVSVVALRTTITYVRLS